MWYAISLGGGLLVGLALMVWGLSERAARHKAERAADEAKGKEEAAIALAKQNFDVVGKLQGDLKAQHDRNAVLTAMLQEAQERLLKCDDPKAIKAWLDDELKGGLE